MNKYWTAATGTVAKDIDMTGNVSSEGYIYDYDEIGELRQVIQGQKEIIHDLKDRITMTQEFCTELALRLAEMENRMDIASLE